MRRLLDALYDGAAVVAALFMIGTLAMVLGGVLGRFISIPLRGMDMYAGYFMAGAGFLALAHTLKRREHVRVTLFLTLSGPGMRRALELWSLGAAVLLAGLFAWFSGKLAYDSWRFNDISTGMDATPLWIPQISMAVGSAVLLIAFLDEFWMELKHRQSSRKAVAAGHA